MSHPAAARAAAALLLALAAAAPLRSQTVPVGDPREDYARVLAILGIAPSENYTIRPLTLERMLREMTSTDHPWADRVAEPRILEQGLRLEPAAVRIGMNSAFAWGQNDGALWQGRGVNVLLGGGVGFRSGGFDVTLSPTIVYSANTPFDLAPLAPPAGASPFAYPYHRSGNRARIDMPQRFGNRAFARVDPGQTQLRYAWRALSVAAGTANEWWGPGIRNAIVMSNNAAGFPHAALGTSHPVSVGIGRLEGRILWGSLRESRYFDAVDTNNARYFTGVIGALSPSLLPGITLGASRVFYQYPPRYFSFGDLFRVFAGVTKKSLADSANPLGNDAADQMLSFFARWALPAAGFETYVEWVRNDHNWDVRDFELEPEHSQGYTLGFQKATELGDGRILRVQGELTHLEQSATSQVRATPTYYTHHIVRQGYTQLGQVIGAGIGPGGDAQYLGADVFTRWGRVGGFVGRQVHDNDAYYALAADSNLSFNRHYVEFQAGMRALAFRGPLELEAELVVSRHLNRYFTLKNDHTNVNLAVAARWRPARSR